MRRELLSVLIIVTMAVVAVGCCSNGNRKCDLKADESLAVSDIDKVVDSIGETITTPPITAVFTGSDGKTKRLYQVTVVFYPSEDRATLSDDENTYQLDQYVTADGYGYKSKKIDLRGKGREATLTYSDGFKLHLTEKSAEH